MLKKRLGAGEGIRIPGQPFTKQWLSLPHETACGAASVPSDKRCNTHRQLARDTWPKSI